MNDTRNLFNSAEYFRQRLKPLPGDPHYLHLADLLLALKTVRLGEEVSLLDYGAGGAPYSSLFTVKNYRTADIENSTDPTYLILPDGTVPEKSKIFDLVLSTQVLEHAENPTNYLVECFRLLKPGGQLILTTHGTYEDHGCPYDFRRWTGDGLERDLRNSGFEDIEIHKLTAGPRALIFLADRFFSTMRTPGQLVPRLIHRGCKAVYHWFRPWVHRALDHYGRNFQMVPSYDSSQILYICLFARGKRPLSI